MTSSSIYCSSKVSFRAQDQGIQLILGSWHPTLMSLKELISVLKVNLALKNSLLAPTPGVFNGKDEYSPHQRNFL